VADGFAQRSRTRAIDDGLRAGTIGGRLNEEQGAKLLKTLQWLASAAGVQDPIVLNQPYSEEVRRQRQLHVYLTSPAAQNLTYCGPKNAVYDAELDAIFIDQDIVLTPDWEILLATPDHKPGLDIKFKPKNFPALRTYLWFVFLHELGHRTLHRSGGGFFDMNRPGSAEGQRQKELEADDFAIAAMEEAFRTAGGHGIQLVKKYDVRVLNYKVTPATPAPELVAVSLLEMALVISTGHLVLPSPTSPFSESVSHPAYLTRSLRIVDRYLDRPDLGPRIARMARLVAASLNRMKRIRESGFVELSTPNPVAAAAFDTEGLVVACGLPWEVRRVRYDRLRELLRRDAPASIPENAETVPIPDGMPVYGLWNTCDAGTVTMGSDGTQAIITRDFKRIVAGKADPNLPGHKFTRLLKGPQPSRYAAAVGERGGQEWLHAFDEGRLTARLEGKTIRDRLSEVLPAGKWRHKTELATVVGGKVHIPVYSPSAKALDLLGFCEVGLPDLAWRGYVGLRIPARLQGFTTTTNPLLDTRHSARQVVCAAEGDGTRYYLVEAVRSPSKNRLFPGRGQGFRVWEISPDADPVQLVEQPFSSLTEPAIGDANPEWGDTPRVLPDSATWVPPGGLALNVQGDSIYFVDLRTREVRTIFEPGRDTIKVRAGPDGTVAVFSTGTYRVFVLNPGPRLRQEGRYWVWGLAVVAVTVAGLVAARVIRRRKVT
jgi:hypothetical protein